MALSGWGDMNENMDWNTLASASNAANSGDRFIRNKNEWNSENHISRKQNNKSGNLNKNDNEQKQKSNQSAKDANNDQEEDENSCTIADVGDWTDMKQFDDDHDYEWFKEEEKKMAELYGGKFIKVKYSSQGNIAYYCELCLVECNSNKKSLESHCHGMKHLKKKNLWENEKKKPFDVEENPIGPVPPSLVPKPKPKPKKDPKKQKRMAPMSPSRMYNPLDGPDLREKLKPSRNSLNYYGSDRYYNEGPMDDPTYPRERSPLRGRMLPTSPERERMAPHYRRSPGADYRRDTRRDLPVSHNISRYNAPPAPDFPKSNRSPSPYNTLNLSTSPAGSLLQKLAECCVNTESDAELAISVVAALTKSMKEYAFKNNEVKIAELLMEAELKMGTVKALKAGMKMLSSVTSTVPDARLEIESRSFGRPNGYQPEDYSAGRQPTW